MKMHTLSTLKLFLLFEICFNLCYAQKKENYTEKDWVNYAKAQGNSYDFTLSSLNNIMADKEYESYLDSMARVDIFKPLVYNGIEIRRSDIKPPVLTGTVSYYFLDGKLASQAEFLNGVANGKCIYYYPNGNIYTKEVYKDGEANAADSLISYYTNGNMASSEFETDTSSTLKLYSYEGKLLAESIGRKSDTITVSEKYFDLETKTEKTRVYKDSKEEENFYDYNGKKITKISLYMLFMKEEKSNPYETYAAFPKRKSRNIEQTDNELFSLHCKKTKNDRKKIILKWEASESFKQCGNCKVLERINSSYLSLSNSSNYPHSDFLDTLYCEPSKQIMRTAQTKKGMLHGELKYYYPSGQLLALLNFKEDYPNGDFMLFYPNGEIKRKNKYNMGNEIDSAFEYSKNKVLKTLTVWEDSVKFIKQTFWEDGKITQQMELCKGENLAVKMQYGRKQAVSKKIIENRYFNKQGEEISKKQFGKDYPSILPKYDPHKTRVKF